MVILNKIYTKTGDDGTTALGTGERRVKHDLRVAAYGAVDEANACIGMARVDIAGIADDVDAMLARIQNDLFDLGADLATPDSGEKADREPLRIAGSQVARLESDIDALNNRLEPLRSFVLPGGSPASAALHLSRTIARRAERLIVELAGKDKETVNGEAIKYINRLSDFLFVSARRLNDNGGADVLWIPGKNR